MRAKVKVVYGPSRYEQELHLPWEGGTNWGRDDWRKGIPWRKLAPEDRYFSPSRGNRPER